MGYSMKERMDDVIKSVLSLYISHLKCISYLKYKTNLQFYNCR